MPWECARCGTVHTQNPSECRDCGHRIFAPLSDEAAGDRADGVDTPDPAAVDHALPGQSDTEIGDPSPDVAVDGSVATADETPATDDDGEESFLRKWLPFL